MWAFYFIYLFIYYCVVKITLIAIINVWENHIERRKKMRKRKKKFNPFYNYATYICFYVFVKVFPCISISLSIIIMDHSIFAICPCVAHIIVILIHVSMKVTCVRVVIILLCIAIATLVVSIYHSSIVGHRALSSLSLPFLESNTPSPWMTIVGLEMRKVEDEHCMVWECEG